MACNNDVQILVGIRITWKAYETRDCCAHSQSSGLAGPQGPAVLMAPSYVDTDAACQGITFWEPLVTIRSFQWAHRQPSPHKGLYDLSKPFPLLPQWSHYSPAVPSLQALPSGTCAFALPCACSQLPGPGPFRYLGLYQNVTSSEWSSSPPPSVSPHLSPSWDKWCLRALLHWNTSSVGHHSVHCIVSRTALSPQRWLNKHLLNEGEKGINDSALSASGWGLQTDKRSSLRQKGMCVEDSGLTFFPSWKTSEDNVSMAVERSSGLWSSVRTIGWMIREA